MFSCCHDSSQLEGWGILSSLFHRKETALLTATATTSPPENDNDGKNCCKKSEEIPPKISPSPTKLRTGAESSSTVPSFSLEEQEKLSKILEYLQKRYTNDQPREEPVENSEEETTPFSQKSPSFFYELAHAATQVALNLDQETVNYDSTSSDFDSGDNPEAAIQRLLQAGKVAETLKQQQAQHMSHIHLLEEDFSFLLLPLRHCWTELELALKHNQGRSSQQAFAQVSSVLLGRRGIQDTLKMLWKILGKEDDNDQSAKGKIYSLIRLCFHFAVAQTFLTTRDGKRREQLQSSIHKLLQANSRNGTTKDCAIQSLVDSFWDFHTKQSVSDNKDDVVLQQHFQQWHDVHAPSLLSSLSMCMSAIFFPSSSEESQKSDTLGWPLPNLDKNDEAADNLLFSSTSGPVSSWLYAVACSMPLKHHQKVGPVWHRLYSSNSQGFNLSTLEHSLTGYHGPTLILLECFDPNLKSDITFGAYASQPWKKQSAPEFYGDEDCFLFQLKPVFKVFRVKSEGEHAHVARNFQYFHFKPATKTPSSQSNFAQGIGLGGSPRHPRFFVASSLDKAHFTHSDATFESSETAEDPTTFSSNPYMDLHSIEVWGVGGDSALEARKQHRSVKEAHLGKARKVNKAAFLNDFRSGLIESKMFDFYEDMRNRDGGCLMDCQDDDDDRQWQIGAPR